MEPTADYLKKIVAGPFLMPRALAHKEVALVQTKAKPFGAYISRSLDL